MEAAGRRGTDASTGVDLADFTRRVYSARAPRTSLARFTAKIQGKPELQYRAPEHVRRHWHQEWRRRIGYGGDGDRDNVILVTAKMGKGEGKSALAADAAASVDRSFASELESRVVFRAEQAVNLVNTLSRGEGWVYDEAGEGLLNTEFWSEESRLLIKAVMMSRDSHTHGFLCIPTIRMFNVGFLNSLVDYWVRVDHRGVAEVHPRPPERYTPMRGIGWFPDREWNPYVWDTPAEWTGPMEGVWRKYRGLRKRSRTASLEAFRDRMSDIRDGGGSRAKAALETCQVCGLTGNRYNVGTHRCPGKQPAPAA